MTTERNLTSALLDARFANDDAGRERARLAALKRTQLLDSPDSAFFDRVTRRMAAVLDVPIVLVSLVDEKRQWFKSRVGLDAAQTPRAISFCAHAVVDRSPLVVPDATLDKRFAGNPMVTGTPHVRAYAGIPLYTSDGHAIGALCAIDRKPRMFSQVEMNTLRDAALTIEACIRAEESGNVAMDEERPASQTAEIVDALRGFVRRRVELEAAASRQQAERLRELPDAGRLYVSYWNRQMRCEFANDAWCARFGHALEHAVGLSLQEAFGPAFVELSSYARLALEGREQRLGHAVAVQPGQFMTHIRCVPDRSRATQIQGFFLSFTG